MSTEDIAGLNRIANRIRLNATRMVAIQGYGYLGQALSSAEIFAALFGGRIIRRGVDRFVLSPGHYAIAMYAVAAEVGLLDRHELDSYGLDGALLEAIGTERTPIADLVCGSLGQGLSGAVGFALAAKLDGEDRDTYAFLSDGVIDANNSQVDGSVTSVTTIEPLADKWRSFGWRAIELDGHDVGALMRAFESRSGDSEPLVVVARTQILGRMRSIPPTVDGHFIKLDGELEVALVAELEQSFA
jgi:transketolase